jgi:hypothetical protein
VRANEQEDCVFRRQVDLVPCEIELSRIERWPLPDQLSRPRQASPFQGKHDSYLLVSVPALAREAGEQIGQLMEEAGAVWLNLHWFAVDTDEQQGGAAVEPLLTLAADPHLDQFWIRDRHLKRAFSAPSFQQQPIFADDERPGRHWAWGNPEQHCIADRLLGGLHCPSIRPKATCCLRTRPPTAAVETTDV